MEPERPPIAPVPRPTRGGPRPLPPPDILPPLPGTNVTPSPLTAPSNSGRSGTSSSNQRNISVLATSQPLPVIYGRQRVGGRYVFASVVNGLLYIVFKICEGPINDIPEVTFGTPRLQASTFGITVTKYFGTSSQGIDPTIAKICPDWTSGFAGQAYVVMVYPPASPSKPSYDPFQPSFLVEGRMVRDPRLDATLVTRYYTQNAALCTADFQTARRFGIGTPDAQMDWAGEITNAANDCEFAMGRPTAPASAPTLGVATSGIGNITVGGYYYTQTFVVNGVESLESVVSVQAFAPAGVSSRLITGILTGPAGTSERRVYRCKSNGSNKAPRFLAIRIQDNTTTQAVDIASDLALGTGPPTSNFRYSMNIALTQQVDCWTQMETLRAHWAGFYTFNNGLYKYYVDKARSNSGLTFSDDPANAARNITTRPKVHKLLTEEVPTRIELTYSDGTRDWQDDTVVVEFPGVINLTLPKIVKQIILHGVDNYDQATRRATQELNQGLCDLIVTARMDFSALQIQIMDRVTLDLTAGEGISGDYLCTDINQDGIGFIGKFKTYLAGTYSDVIGTAQPPPPPIVIDHTKDPLDVPKASIVVPNLGQLYFQAARVYTAVLEGASFWSQLGLANYVAANVNDGITTVKAFDAAAAADAWLQFDAGSGNQRTFGKVVISFLAAPSSNQQWQVEWSDDGVNWFAP